MSDKPLHMSDKPLGRLCWYELMTTDPDAACDFYGRITGWGTSTWDGGDKPYVMWMNGEMPVGGVMDLPSRDVPPCWMAYVSTPDLDGTLDKVRSLGGAVHAELQVDEVGRFAVLGDPQGGVIAIIEPEGDTPGHDGPPAVGEFSWCDLATTDMEAAWSFYSEVFGWEKADRMDMGDMGFYQMFSRGAHPLGGMLNGPEGMPVGWLYYIRVPDARAAAETIKELGGQITNGPMVVPGGNVIAHGMDAHGVPFAVHSVTEG